MDNKFLKLCGKSIKANRDKYGRDFAVFSKKKTKKTRELLKAKRCNDTFGNWPVFKFGKKTKNKSQKKNEKNLSISKLEAETKQNLLNARKLRRKYGIYVFPESETTPLPIFKFEQLLSKLNVNKTICSNLKKWKICRPLPVQMQAIPIMIQGHELQCCAPTGSGKTIAFIIPILSILQRTIDINKCNTFCNDDCDEDIDYKMSNNNVLFNHVKCLIIAPSTVLIHQIYREFVKYSKGLDIGIYCNDENNINDNNIKEIHIIISTPKPLAKLIRNNEIACDQIEIVVLDEADALFDNDTDIYLNDIELVMRKCNDPNIQKAFFSATLDDKIMNLMQENYLNDPFRVSIGHGICGAANIEQELIYCGDERGKFIELLKIIENGLKPPILLFVSDNKRIIELQKQLKNYQKHLIIDTLNKNLSIKEKNDIVTRFRNDNIWFLICNDDLTRGMDFLNVQTIINYDFPKSSQQYIHRIGRTGRVDKFGKSITFWCDVDYKLLSIVINIIKKSKQTYKLPKWILNDENINKNINDKERIVAKVGITKRGPIRRGGQYIHGTSVLNNNNKKKKVTKLKRKINYHYNKEKKKKSKPKKE